MKNIDDINKAAVKKIVAKKKISEFSPGDTIKVGIKNTNANFYIDSPKSVINLLNDISTCLK